MSREDSSVFTFEHQELYQKLQYKFYDAVESMDHNNIVVSNTRCRLYVHITFLTSQRLPDLYFKEIQFHGFR